jgi:deoxyadenosine/deoxycytidine kinase
MLISIEGNIGSGKSTLLNFFKQLKRENIIFVDEPVDEWIKIKDNNGNNALQLFYDNQEMNSFWFQIMAYITRLRNLLDVLEDNSDKIIICERSIYTDKYVFAQMLYDMGYIKEIEWKTYLYWFDTFKNKTNIDLILYVNTQPKECYNRINIRNRDEEKNNISLDYLQKCHQKHTEWLYNSDIRVITIDGHQSIEIIQNVVETINFEQYK